MRYRDLLSRANTSWKALIIFFVALVIIDVSAQLYALLNPSSSIAIAIANGLDKGITQVLLLIIGAGIAIISGYFTTISTMELENGKIRDNLIIGFYYEIKELSEKFENVPTDNYTNCLTYLIRNKIHFYSEKGLYFELKKELFSLDKEFLEKILFIYPKITYIDELINFEVSQSGGTASADVVHIHTYVNEIKPNLKALLKLLKDEKKKIEK